ncbi:adenylate/guanylate cyclase domain-containing protein [Salinispira pacifica]|uniref:Adenylate cyclase n=1 Tax=Salinispira pacifica TaxID=1307761 RepID=V5WKW7_9SPIO|nr:adenylate/guanylate cyclase domain-containing protein [Salinispira pacifica]AHC16290.1 Adenylate cyclase [Salinispira pacifica]
MRANLRKDGERTAYLVAREEYRAELRISLFRTGFILILLAVSAARSLASGISLYPQLLPLLILLGLSIFMLADIWWLGRSRLFIRFYKPAHKYLIIILDLLRFSVGSSYFTLLMFNAGFATVFVLLSRREFQADIQRVVPLSALFTAPALAMPLISAYVSRRVAHMVRLNSIQQQLERYLPPALTRESLEKSKIPIDEGFGHRGDVVFGSIGGQQRRDFTAVGDTVNTASRLQSISRKLDSDIIISEDLLKELNKKILRNLELKDYGRASVREKQKPFRIYGIQIPGMNNSR